MRTLIAMALVLGAVVLTAACGADRGPSTETVNWTDGWKAGVAAAEAKGTPMLVYVGRKSPG